MLDNMRPCTGTGAPCAATVDVVVVNWNAGPQLAACLASLRGSDQTGFSLERVVMVDNASHDGSADQLEGGDPPVTLIRNEENRGFAAACNQGARGSRADYLLFLNPDARLHEDSLRRAVEFMQASQHAEIGICGIRLVGDDGHVSRSCAQFPSAAQFIAHACGLTRILPPRAGVDFMMSGWPHDTDRSVDHVIGAFFLVRRTLFEALAGFDERYFVYFEDLDFSLRARRAGYGSYYLASAEAFHKGGGTSEQVRATRLFFANRSRIIYAYTHFGRLAGTGVLLATLLVEPVVRVAVSAAKLSGAQLAETVSGFAQLYRDTPATLRRVW
jgi:N-acetylglucosaminyl-diphospho-decaprenol L-rhamnosyltransferase